MAERERRTAPPFGGTFVAAYGPWWNSFRAWSWVDTRSAGHNHAGMFFDVNESGYYALLLTPPVDGRGRLRVSQRKLGWQPVGHRTPDVPCRI